MKQRSLLFRPIQISAPVGLLLIMVAMYIVTATYLAINLKRDILPDEVVHLALSEQYATSWTIPTDKPETYAYGYLGHRPFLYYWINGRLINVAQIIQPEISSWGILVLLRLVSMGSSLLAVVFAYLLAREVTQDPWGAVLAVFLLTTTAMFVFLSAGATYDTLVNMFCFASVYSLARVLKGKSFLANSLAWAIAILLATLTKITALPLLAIETLVWIGYAAWHRNTLFRTGGSFRALWNTRNAILTGAVLLLGMLNFSVYGVNFIRYRSLSPACEKVLSVEQCQENPVVRRDQQLYLAQSVSWNDIFQGHASDPFQWFFDFWIPAILRGIFGILSHQVYIPGLILSVYRVWLFGLLLLAVRFWKWFSPGIVGMVIILLFYTLILLYTNFTTEMRTGFSHVAIQGRYLFPVISAFYTLAALVLIRIPNTYLRGFALGCTLVLFAWGSPLKILLYPAEVLFPGQAIPAEQAAFTVTKHQEVSQELRSECRGNIVRLEILAAANPSQSPIPVTIRLTDISSGEIVREVDGDGSVVGARGWLSVPFSPLANTSGRSYRMTISAPDATPEQSLFLLNSASNVYRGGDAFVGNTPTNMDLVFRFICRQPAPVDWFIER